ncbi:MAG: hypothetical protein R2748_10490 [Bryobacterales bacterium]
MVGLGQVGDLTPGALAATVSHGLRRYGVERISRVCDQGDGAPRQLAVTALLVGAGEGGLGVADSLQSILRGVRMANAKLDDGTEGRRARIARVDFVELYEDRALSAVNELSKLNFSGGDFARRLTSRRR